MKLTAERAADLTSRCHVDHDWRAAADKRYSARYWQDSRWHYGIGPTALAAVLDAHRAYRARRRKNGNVG